MILDILGLGTANPPHSMSQQESVQLAIDVCDLDEQQQRLLKILYRKSGVKQRRTSVPHRIALDWIGGGSGNSRTLERGPTTSERMGLYNEHAFPVAAEAVQSAFSQTRIDGDDITHLITVSCTGFAAPGVDIALINQFQLPATTQRVHVGFMGCHGAINGLRVAQAIGASDSAARILLCAVECCSLHYFFHWDPDRFMGNALFADGAAAVICERGNKNNRLSERNNLAATESIKGCLAATSSCLIPDSLDAMTWDIGDHGFEMYLSARVPSLIEEHLRPWLSSWLAENGLTIEDVPSWAVHPGGPRILQAVENALQLQPDQLAKSREVLANYGNMSSPTVLFILDRIGRQAECWPCVALGFGPGLSAEAALFI